MSQQDPKATIRLAGDELFLATGPSGSAQLVETNSQRARAATPMEMLLIALGGCTAVDIVSILRKKREKVTDYRVEIRGTRREEAPRYWTRMEVHHIIHGHKVSEKSVAQAIELSETKYCSVAATLRPTVEIVSSYEIVEDSGDEA